MKHNKQLQECMFFYFHGSDSHEHQAEICCADFFSHYKSHSSVTKLQLF